MLSTKMIQAMNLAKGVTSTLCSLQELKNKKKTKNKKQVKIIIDDTNTWQ